MSAKELESIVALSITGGDANHVVKRENKVPASTLQGSKTFHIPEDITWSQRLKLILSPIQKRDKIHDGNNVKTVIVVSPEAFRMLFYIGFWMFSSIAIFTSLMWADINYSDNILKDYFGSVNICVFYDFPPFSYFGSTLWLPNVFIIIIYLILDLLRVGDAVNDGEISTTFHRCYYAVTIFEIFASALFLQITATSPVENVYIHTIPFLISTFAQWTLALKRLLWFMKMNVFLNYPRYYYYSAWIYIVMMFVTMAGKNMVNIPNLCGAQLWTIKGLEWTAPFAKYNDMLFVSLTMVCPLIVYYVAARDVETMVITFDREKTHRKAAQSK